MKAKFIKKSVQNIDSGISCQATIREVEPKRRYVLAALGNFKVSRKPVPTAFVPFYLSNLVLAKIVKEYRSPEDCILAIRSAKNAS